MRHPVTAGINNSRATFRASVAHLINARISHTARFHAPFTHLEGANFQWERTVRHWFASWYALAVTYRPQVRT